MDREFTVSDTKSSSDNIVKKDRIYLRLKSDRTVKIYSRASRPFLEWRKKAPKEEEKKKKLFETAEEAAKEESTLDQMKNLRSEQEALYDTDGAW